MQLNRRPSSHPSEHRPQHGTSGPRLTRIGTVGTPKYALAARHDRAAGARRRARTASRALSADRENARRRRVPENIAQLGADVNRLLPTLVRDLDLQDGAWTVARLRAFLAGPPEVFENVKILSWGIFPSLDTEDGPGSARFTGLIADLVDKCAGSLERVEICSQINGRNLDKLYAAICRSRSVTDLAMILMDHGLAFTDKLVEFPSNLRKLWIETGGYKLPPKLYEALERIESLEELKCDFEMSEPFQPPGEKLASKLTGFRTDSKFVNKFLDLPGIRLEKITNLRVVFAPGTRSLLPNGEFPHPSEAAQLEILETISARLPSLERLETYGLRLNILTQISSIPPSWRELIASNAIVKMDSATYQAVRAKIESSSLDRFQLLFDNSYVLRVMAQPEMLEHWRGMRGFAFTVSDSWDIVIEDDGEGGEGEDEDEYEGEYDEDVFEALMELLAGGVSWNGQTNW